MKIIKVIKKGRPVFVVKKKILELDKDKLSHKFLTHNFSDDTEVYIKCLEDGTIDFRGKRNEYRTIPITAIQVK